MPNLKLGSSGVLAYLGLEDVYDAYLRLWMMQ